MTPDIPGRRATDGSGDSIEGSARPRPEPSLWAKADLLDGAGGDPPRTDERTGRTAETTERAGPNPRPDGEARPLPRRFGPPEQALWRKADLLDARPAPPPPADRREAPDSQRPRDVSREARSDRVRFPIHEQKANEILERERPLVDRVAGVVKRQLDGRSPEGWDSVRGRARTREILSIVNQVREAFGTAEVKVKVTDDPDVFGSYRHDRSVHRIEVGKNLSLGETMATVVHEVRHAYQTEVIEGVKPDHPDSDAWDKNDQRYIDYTRGNIVSYFTQPLEADAYGFERATARTLGLDWPNL